MFAIISHHLTSCPMAKLSRCPDCAARWLPTGPRLDVQRHCVSWPGGEARLTPGQARLLTALADRGDVVARERLVDAVWGDRADGGPDSASALVSVLVHGLRRRLASAGFPGMVRTWPRTGYELVLTG
jgi:DNA-binding response OmpR family regulator